MDAQHAENTKRIAKNTLMLYVRMLFSMLVSLYTSRVVLNTLGVEDYGIYNVVGGLVAMFSLVSNSLSASVSRFLTFELGRGDMQRLKETFSTSVLIHIALAVVVFVLAESLGVWFLNTQMTIPADRLTAANWVFQASILSFMFGLFSVSYNASIVAHERMKTFAYIGILDVVLRLLIVLFVAYVPFSYDKLIVYALLQIAVSFALQLIYLRYCRKNFEECRLRWRFNRQCWKEMSGFAGWNFIGCTAVLLKDHGVNVLLNIFIGPIVNAARGIATSVNTAVGAFAGNFMVALNPQITKSYAANDKTFAFSLIERGSRFSFYILLFLALPILFETDFVLTVWLKHYPDHTVNFVRLILCLSLVDSLSNTLITLQLATGKIRNYQLVVGGVYLINFPLSYCCLKAGYSPESTLVVALIVAILCLLLRLTFLHYMTGLSVCKYLNNVCLNVLIVFVVAAILPGIILHILPDSWFRFLLVTFISLVCVAITVCFVGCSTRERKFIMSKTHEIVLKVVKIVSK